MTEPLIISIDVMGGDFGPSVTLAGADMELKRRPEIRYELFGDEAVVKPVLDRYPTVKAASNFHHCEVTVAMDAKPSTALDRCLARPEGQTTYGMVECIGVETQIQDARLNRAYQAAIARLERPRQKAALQKAQQAWIAFRDADCASYLDEDWGSMARVEAQQCVLDRTVERADELEVFRKWS